MEAHCSAVLFSQQWSSLLPSLLNLPSSSHGLELVGSKGLTEPKPLRGGPGQAEPKPTMKMGFGSELLKPIPVKNPKAPASLACDIH